MDESKIEMFMIANRQYLPTEYIISIQEKLATLDNSKWLRLSFIQFKDPNIALVLSIFLGGWGIDRFYMGDIVTGVLKLITCGGLGIWTFIDWFLICRDTKLSNFNKFMMTIN